MLATRITRGLAYHRQNATLLPSGVACLLDFEVFGNTFANAAGSAPILVSQDPLTVARERDIHWHARGNPKKAAA